jgi:hypothetical protein
VDIHPQEVHLAEGSSECREVGRREVLCEGLLRRPLLEDPKPSWYIGISPETVGPASRLFEGLRGHSTRQFDHEVMGRGFDGHDARNDDHLQSLPESNQQSSGRLRRSSTRRWGTLADPTGYLSDCNNVRVGQEPTVGGTTTPDDADEGLGLPPRICLEPMLMEIKMRAFAVRSLGEPASLQDLPVPTAHAEVLIRARFAGVNPLDNNLLGRLTAASPYPFVVGIDFAGVAERVPAGVHGLQAGDRDFGMARTHGSYAEFTSVDPAAARCPSRRSRRCGRFSCSRSPQASTSW